MSEENIMPDEVHNLLNEQSAAGVEMGIHSAANKLRIHEDDAKTFKSLKSVWKNGSRDGGGNMFNVLDSKRSSVDENIP